MGHITKIQPKLPEYLETGGGVQKIMGKLDDLHEKELAAMMARHDFELTSLKKKQQDQKASDMAKQIRPTKAKVRTNKSVK